MCGLVGMASSSLNAFDKKAFRDMLFFDQIRGKHSTGVLAVNKNGVPAVYKKALQGSDFVQLAGFETICYHADTLLLGHNRYATLGAKDDNNAHPFQHGDITLVHNGTLTVSTVHEDTSRKFATDSESICFAMNESGNCKDVLESLQGAYALIWHDSSDNTLHFARNAERDLYIGTSGGDVVWASLKNILTLTAEHHKLPLHDVELLPIGKHVVFDLDNLKEIMYEEDFTPKKPRMRVVGGTRGGTTKTTTTTKSTMPAVSSSIIGSKKRGWLFQVKSTGYFQASTPEGDTISGSIDISDVDSWQSAMCEGRMMEGVVRSTCRKQDGTDTLYMSSKHLKLVADDADNQVECGICSSAIYAADINIEKHGEEFFHEECLDVLYPQRGNNAY